VGRNELKNIEQVKKMKLKLNERPKERKLYLRIQLSIQEYDPNRDSKRKIKLLFSKNLNYDIFDERTATDSNLAELRELIKKVIKEG
jgi:hypothetical protein